MRQFRDQYVNGVRHAQLERGGVDTRVAAEVRILQQVAVDEQAHTPVMVIHQPQHAHGAGRDVQQLEHMLRRCE